MGAETFQTVSLAHPGSVYNNQFDDSICSRPDSLLSS
jgi:hypothetical protein